MINIAICDDDPNIIVELSNQLKTFFTKKYLTNSITAFYSGNSLLESNTQYDLIFLDIQMRGLTGMETAKLLRAKGATAYLVFVTVLSDYVYDAFEVEAIDYLLKPVNKLRFSNMLNRLYHKLQNKDKNSLLLFSKGNTYKSIPFKDIYYCEALNHKIYIHTKSLTIDWHMKIDQLKEHLDQRFYRCHRSYLINLDYVIGYEKGLILLQNGDKIPISRLRIQEFSEKMLQYIKEEDI